MDKFNSILTDIQNISQFTYINVLIAIIIVFASMILGSMIAYLAIKLLDLNKKRYKKAKENPWYYVIKTIIICFGIYLSILVIDFPENIINIIMKIFKIVIIIMVAKIIVRFLTPKSRIFKKLKENERFNKNEPLTNFVEKIAKYVIYSIAGFMIIAELGYDLSGLITGIGLSRSCNSLSSPGYC